MLSFFISFLYATAVAGVTLFRVAKESYQRKQSKGFVCDRSQCEMKGTIRIGSGHNFGMPSGMNKIMGTATVQRQGIFQSLAFTYWFCDYRSMRFRNTTHTTLFCQSPDQIKIFSL